MAVNENDIEITFCEQKIDVFLRGTNVGYISWHSNPYHCLHCYLKLNLKCLDSIDSKHLFNAIRRQLGKPLQVMISSTNVDQISFLEKAGFLCKRRCYEVDATIEDYVGRKMEHNLLRSNVGEQVYEQSCEMMYNRYIQNHETISPWTGTKEQFIHELPDVVLCSISDGAIKNCAFIEENEVAYVYGFDKSDFHAFAESLSSTLFEKYESISFEADDCDVYAMELKSLFLNQSNDSFNTYIL